MQANNYKTSFLNLRIGSRNGQFGKFGKFVISFDECIVSRLYLAVYLAVISVNYPILASIDRSILASIG